MILIKFMYLRKNIQKLNKKQHNNNLNFSQPIQKLLSLKKNTLKLNKRLQLNIHKITNQKNMNHMFQNNILKNIPKIQDKVPKYIQNMFLKKLNMKQKK